MPDATILVIDDSTTIRRLVDTHLSPEGYHVILAATAEDGLALAAETQPNLILLDHQLPGTTGSEVARALSESHELRHIPVVISSTQRKKAYVEYVDLDNVVDMLPKPYTEELLRTTVANALETASMIVQSQEQGSAVPETIRSMDEAVLSGNLQCFTLREMIDFLNNGRKVGVLEVESESSRIRFSLENGRIQAVHAAGIGSQECEELCARLPRSLASLAPLLK
ncbi:MAG: response regulator, partial [Planctomycetota bacterium]